jgi:hypothetical protein
MIEFDLSGLLLPLLMTLLFNIGLMVILRKHDTNHQEHIFTFFIVGMVIFFLCYSLKSFDLNMGMAIGLFAIFGIIRYRTEALSPQVISYLFATIGISVINALAGADMGWIELIFVNVVVLISILLAEKFFIKNLDEPKEEIKSPPPVELEKCTFIIPLEDGPQQSAIQLAINQMEKNLGISVQSHRIAKIDFQMQMIQLQVYYAKE